MLDDASNMEVNPTLVLFAKSPEPGRVKTRLMPKLDAQQATKVATLLIEHTVRLAVNSWPGPIALHTWPDTNHEVLKSLSDTHGLQLAAQKRGDLGQKMHGSISQFTEQGGPAAVMGCDVPHCPGELLGEAYGLLKQGQNVIGPTIDGGYYLIGLQKAWPEIFKEIQWGSDSVLRNTLRAAQRCGVHFTLLASLRDIDRFEDLQCVVEDVPELRSELVKFLSSSLDP